MRYLIWDWNGTLLDDVDAAVAALNRMLVKRGVAPTTREYYRAHFGFPVRPFYAELGVDLEKCDWDGICEDFHAFVAEEPQTVRPAAREALEAARSAGFRQCILSALREDLLRRDVRKAGLAEFFQSVCGVDNLDGASKLSRGKELVAALGDGGFCFIGDTLHDAEVARALGGACVLVACGHQRGDRLAAAGVPVAEDLVSAVRLAVSPEFQKENLI